MRQLHLHLLALLMCACGGSSSADTDAQVITHTVPTLTSIQARIFTPHCATAGCHRGSAPPQGLDLETFNSWQNLVNVPSREGDGVLRVNPGDPDRSFLIDKLEGVLGPDQGARMPFDRSPLPQSEIDVVRDWIASGAPNN
jgi:hypothetical protein